MDSKITINIVEPGTPPSPTPIDPATPNTGLFTSGIGGPEATIITAVSAVLLLTIAAIVVAVCYRKQKKAGKVTKLVHIIDSTKAIITSKKRLSAALTAIALLVSAGTFVALAKNAVNASESDEQSQAEGTNDSSLTVDVSSEELTIEVADEPVFAVLPVEVTVEEATEAGYTLTAYTDNTDLVSITNPDNIIPMVTLPESSVETLESSETAGELTALTDNTYGLALGEEPTTKDAEVYMPLSIDSDILTIIKSMPEYTPTEENDKTTIYYGFYITPDIPYGTYTGSDIYYNATINTTPVTFDGKGLYFNDDPEQTTNEVTYIAVSEEGKEYNINQIVSGEYKEPSQDLPYNFLGWSTDSTATVPTYETEEKIAEFLPISPNTPITLYAVWQKATTITYDSNGGAGEMNKQTIIAGESDSLYKNTFTRDGYTFTGWNTVAEPTEQEPSKTYEDQAEYIAPATSQNLTLYAQWEEDTTINDLTYMQDFKGLSEADKASVLKSMTLGQQYQLIDNRGDKKSYYIAKLADGNVWMTQNLDLDIVNGGAGLDSSNTDVPANWGDAGKLANTYTDTTWNNSTTAPESYDPGDFYWDGTLNTNWDGNLDNETVTDPSATSGGTHYHIGNYYNWTAAVAMSDSSSYTTNQQDTNQSICPAGWRLPTYSGDKSYENLISVQGLTAGASGNIQNGPVYFDYEGDWSGSSNNVGSYGGYWYSVAISLSSAYQLSFYEDGTLNSQYSGWRGVRGVGYAIRCVAW